MECERWASNEEVEMDVDLTVEEELSLLSEISQTRGTLAINPSLQQPESSPVATQYKVTLSVQYHRMCIGYMG